LRDNKKTYGFTISFYEWEKTIPTLWSTVKEFMNLYPQYVSPENAMNYLSDDDGEKYNLCHFWSNFEIADMDFWRSEAYTKFFEFLDSKGGFYYERWGDAPVHSIAAALFMPKDQLTFSVTLDIVMNRSSIVQKVKIGRGESVAVIRGIHWIMPHNHVYHGTKKCSINGAGLSWLDLPKIANGTGGHREL
jgi:hypothetical protein